jgi:L-xylulokinase
MEEGMSGYLLGIDAGNTMVKAVLFEADGRDVAAEVCDGATRQPKPGYVERDIREMWACAVRAVQGCLQRSGIAASEILGIGCAGHGNGAYLLDGAGEPLLGIQSLDTRAADLVEQWNASGVSDRLYPLCLQKPWPAQTGTLLAWLARHDPDLFGRVGHVLLCKDTIVRFLTGRVGSDFSDVSGAGLLRLPDRRYDDQILALYGLEASKTLLPSVAEPTDVVGRVTREAAAATGLAEGTPVVAGLFDAVASAIGTGVVQPGEASIVAGSWSVNQLVCEAPRIDPEIFLSSTFRRDRYMAMEASATSAANLEWFVREMMADTVEHLGRAATFELCSEMVRTIAPSIDLPLFHPYLYGSGSNGRARAGFYGIGGWHGRAHLAHAVFEGVVFGHRDHIGKLRGDGATVESATLSGGASRSRVWTQMFADILGIPISTARCAETGALGGAIAAAVGVGLHGSLEDAGQSMTECTGRFDTNHAHAEVFEERYRLFEALGATMGPAWTSMARAN